ncbi:unnamed protein product, partial [marine sediment metagenome]
QMVPHLLQQIEGATLGLQLVFGISDTVQFEPSALVPYPMLPFQGWIQAACILPSGPMQIVG